MWHEDADAQAHVVGTIYEDEAGAWRWRAKGHNGEVVAVGEAYVNKGNAIRSFRSLFPSSDIVVVGVGEVSGR